MYHLPNLVNICNVVNEPKENEAACEDIMATVMEAYILAPAIELLDTDSLTATPSTGYFPEGSSELDSFQQQTSFSWLQSN